VKIRLFTLLICAGALGLSACGNRGALDRPPPIWGGPQEAPAEDGESAAEADEYWGDDDDRTQRLPRLPGDDPFEDE